MYKKIYVPIMVIFQKEICLLLFFSFSAPLCHIAIEKICWNNEEAFQKIPSWQFDGIF